MSTEHAAAFAPEKPEPRYTEPGASLAVTVTDEVFCANDIIDDYLARRDRSSFVPERGKRC